MPVFQVDVQKRLVAEYWTNRYFVSDDTIAGASLVAEDIADAERLFHGNAVEFVSVRTSTVAEGDDTYVTTPLFGFGELTLTDYLPLWNVIRVLFGGTGGRPYYKLYRGCLDESNVLGSVLSAPLITAVNSACAVFSGVVTTGLGELLATGTVDPRVRMRQLRRGKRKRTTPVLPT